MLYINNCVINLKVALTFFLTCHVHTIDLNVQLSFVDLDDKMCFHLTSESSEKVWVQE